MSNWYEHYFVPEDPDFKPTPGQTARLLWALYDGGFVPRTVVQPGFGTSSKVQSHQRAAGDGACLVHTGPGSSRPFPCPCSVEDVVALGQGDYRLIWQVEDIDASGLKYPLGEPPYEGMPYDLEVHSAGDYVYHTSSVVDPFDRTVVCRCGEPLEYDEDPWGSGEDLTRYARPVFYERRVRRTCLACGAAFQARDFAVRIRDPRTGEDLGPRAGGATYRFAVFVECYKCSNPDRPDRASDEFLGLCQEAIGAPLFQFGDCFG